MKGRRNLAALATLAIILVAVILPLALVGISLVKEVTGVYQRVKTGQVNFGAYFAQIVAAMPAWASTALERLGLDDLSLLQAKLTAAITARGEALAGRAVDIGGNVLDLAIEFAMAMYLLYLPAARRRRPDARHPRRDPARAGGQGARPRALHDRDPGDGQGQRPRRRGAGCARRPRLLVPRRPRRRCSGP